MVRLLLEYACPVWNPHQVYLSDKLSVQRNGTRWIVGKDAPYEDRLKTLNLSTHLRREFLSLVKLFKFIMRTFVLIAFAYLF